MIRYLVFSVFILFLPGFAQAQNNTLFDDSRVSSVYIDLPADSFNVIMTDILSDHYFRARFIFDDGITRDTLQDVGFRLRGNTSRYAKKKSFKISFNEYVSGRKYQGVKKINLNGQHNDPTMIREKLFYDIWKRSAMPERRTSFVMLYINQEYRGLYTNLEEMDKQWLEGIYSNPDGNLYKCTYPADLVYIGSSQQLYKDIPGGSVTGGRAYDLQTNETLDDYTDFVNLVTILNQPADSLFVTAITQILNVDMYLKSLAIDVASGNWDNYAYNKNNFFLYDNPSGGRFEYYAYDNDNTFGVDWSGIDWTTRNCLDWLNHNEPRPLTSKLLAIPSFRNRYELFLDTLARCRIAPDSIFPRIDSIKDLITPAAITDTYRTMDYGYTFDDFKNGFIQTIDDHTPYGIKPFLNARKQSILDQIHPAGIGDTEGKTPWTVFPNPASGSITLFAEENFFTVSRLFILDIYGRPVKEFPVKSGNNNHFQLAVSDLVAGFYFIKILTSGDCYLKIIVKE
ncbi:MAG: CotH kinase family protein [Bacteroidetes bacterium]|nr:CotH kinase family protein [Bacteroidota bacterium]